MSIRHVISCGGLQVERQPGDRLVTLLIHGAGANVNLDINEITKQFADNIPAVLIDLLELAAYIYAADQACKRGAESDVGEKWRRTLVFHLPVRAPDVWNKPAVISALGKLLNFLSEDNVTFYFYPLNDQEPKHQMFMGKFSPRLLVDEVVLFSGGLDSLAGALEELAPPTGRRVAFVSHTSATKNRPTVTNLIGALRSRRPRHEIRHVCVDATKSSTIHSEFTQRTRSFLYAAIATTVAVLAGRDRIRFYENGVTSMNLPLADQVLGARATRTTHPITIERFSEFFSQLLGRSFKVETPFFWKTKTDIVRLIREHGCADLIRHTVSCSRTIEATLQYPHCGRCSQCIDRRFAVLAAGLADADDPASSYKVDLMRGDRVIGVDRSMVESFVQRAQKLRTASDEELLVNYAASARALRHLGVTPDDALRRLADLHRRHGIDVVHALDQAVERHALDLQRGLLPDACLISMASANRYRQQDTPDTPNIPVFRRKKRGWEVWFERDKAEVDDVKGVRYLDQLVSTPGQSWNVMELLGAEHPGEVDLADTAPTFATDQQTIESCRKKAKKLAKDIAAFREAKEFEKLAAAEREQEGIANYLKETVGLHGQSRRDSDAWQKARQSVGKAVRITMKAIEREHRTLGEHLKKQTHLGFECVYELLREKSRTARRSSAA
jgi:7-cyano-7-deazaguanine synthase in queuosine biosynthesis